MITKEVTIEIQGEKPVDVKQAEQLLKDIAALKSDDQNRISQIVKNPKALTALKDNWEMLKGFIGV